MGASLCAPRKKKTQVGASWVGNESDNPFDIHLNKKDRTLIRETWQRLDEPKEIVGIIFLDIVNDVEPELKKVFGVERAPRAAMLKMPKLGGHVHRFWEFMEQLTTMLGTSENITGAWQLVRKTGRSHVKQGFLEQNQNQMEKNYFEIVLNVFIEKLTPYLTGELEIPSAEPKDQSRKVRFAQNYTNSQIADVWKKFLNIVISQMTDSFELERAKQKNAQTTKALAPHQHVEISERKKKKVAEKQSEIENTAVSNEPKEQEQMFEDPF